MNPPPLPHRVARFIRENRLARPGEKWLVGVSGGPDSVCLLHVLCQLQPELGLILHAVHLDHGLRGAEAEADARYVAVLAAKLNVPLSSGKKDVLDFKRSRRCSLEEAAREMRFLYFSEEAAAQQAARVAVAHTLDDQAETVLLHLVRGTGAGGLKGMSLQEDWHSRATGARISIVRPLLPFTRAETEAYCRDHHLEPRFDASNRSPLFRRNRIRAELIPLLESFNPRIKETLARAAGLVAREQEGLQAMASPLLARLVRVNGPEVALDLKGTLVQPVGLQRYLLRSAWLLLHGDLRDLEAGHIDAMVGLLAGGAGRSLDLPGGTIFRREYDQAVLAAAGSGGAPATARPSAPLPLAVPGETVGLGHKFITRLEAPEEVNLNQIDPGRIHLDAGRAGKSLLARTRLPGDRFEPLGLFGEKKLQDFMVDARIPRKARAAIPLVCSPEHILWVVGYRIDDRAKVTDATTEVLTIEAAPIED